MAERRTNRSGSRGGEVSTVLTWEKFQTICETLAYTGAKYRSCEAHAVSYMTVTSTIAQQEAEGDPEWRALWDLSMEQFKESLEDEARIRARDGRPEPVFYKGKIVGEVQRYSDKLMSQMLTAHRPELYGDRLQVTHTTAASGSFDMLAELSLDARKRIRDIIVADLREQAEMRAARDNGDLIEGTARLQQSPTSDGVFGHSPDE